MKSNTVALREYELVRNNNVRSVQDEIDDDDDDEHPIVVVESRGRGFQNRILVVLGIFLACTLVIGVVVVASTTSKDNQNASLPPVSADAHDASSSAVEVDKADTHASTPSASPPPTSSSSPSFHCVGDRIQNGVLLETNYFLCDSHNRYRFGMNRHGSLIYADDAFNKTAIIYDGTKGDAFELQEDGRFTVKRTISGSNSDTQEHDSDNNIVWELECSDDVSFSPQCLPTHHAVYDCPYLHLHSGGTIVLNWIDFNDDWKERNILHMYNLPKCHDHFFCY